MNIESIGFSGMPESPAVQWPAGSSAANQDFGTMLASGVDNVDRAVQTAQDAVTRFAIGDDTPPHQVMLALEDARLQLQFALQVRSKLVEGYQELMRMQI